MNIGIAVRGSGNGRGQKPLVQPRYIFFAVKDRSLNILVFLVFVVKDISLVYFCRLPFAFLLLPFTFAFPLTASRNSN
ncbi:MAG: hypothetical protein AB1757_16870 [Acidobacteriota bacterium]